MTKLEQLSELLVSEISQFEKTVQRLEKIQKEQIGIDSSKLENALQQQREEIEKTLDSHKNEMSSLTEELKNAKAYPVWAICIFIGSILLNGILVYVFTQKLFIGE
ncbi:DUF6730 family protein [Salegentibacter sp. HM20]